MSGSAPGLLTILVGFVADLNNWIEGPPKPPPPPKPPMAPHELHTLWACLSAGVLTGCAYVPFFAAALIGKTPAALIAEFVHAPADPPAALVIWFAVVLIAVFIVWHRTEHTLSVHEINTNRRELFYWAAILFTFALGTAAGDLVAERMHLGYLVSALAFAGVIAGEAAIFAAAAFTPISFLWYNVIGCVMVVGTGLLFRPTGAKG